MLKWYKHVVLKIVLTTGRTARKDRTWLKRIVKYLCNMSDASVLQYNILFAWPIVCKSSFMFSNIFTRVKRVQDTWMLFQNLIHGAVLPNIIFWHFSKYILGESHESMFCWLVNMINKMPDTWYKYNVKLYLLSEMMV